ncbi:MAG: zinc uptake transcriptional repressor Zur [Acuticoccus sp.]
MSVSPKNTTAHDHAGAAAKLTRNEQLVQAVLDAADAPLGAYAILDAVREGGMRSPPQVYRALERLQQRGLAHRIEHLNAFVACRRDACDGSATIFAVCSGCGETREFADPAFDALVAGYLRDNRFAMQVERCELVGLCAVCAAG